MEKVQGIEREARERIEVIEKNGQIKLGDMVEVEKSSVLDTVFHVHDELVTLVRDDPLLAEAGRRWLKNCMSTPPPWAQDFPMEAVVWVGKRYRK